jgi:hypothetical protein
MVARSVRRDWKLWTWKVVVGALAGGLLPGLF